MITKEQILKEIHICLVNPAVACNDIMDVHSEDGESYALRFNDDGTSVVTVDGVEYKIKMTLKIISEHKVGEEYERAESPEQLLNWLKVACPDAEISIFDAQSKLQDFNEGMADLEGKGVSVAEVDAWIADFICQIGKEEEEVVEDEDD
jgi:aconitase A